MNGTTGAPAPTFWLQASPTPLLAPPRAHNDPTFLRETLWGRLRFAVATVTPVSVGCEEWRFNGKQFLRAMALGSGGFAIPGTSWKGVVRALAEVLAPCEQYPNAGKAGQGICPAASLFGCIGRQGRIGRISFGDTIFSETSELVRRDVGSVPRAFPPHQEKEGMLKCYRDPQQSSSGGECDVIETVRTEVPKTTDAATLRKLPVLEIFCNGLYDYELGWLLTALGQHPNYPFLLSVGYAKPQRLGRVRLIPYANVLKRGRHGGESFAVNIGDAALFQRYRHWIETACGRAGGAEWRRVETNLETLKRYLPLPR